MLACHSYGDIKYYNMKRIILSLLLVCVTISGCKGIIQEEEFLPEAHSDLPHDVYRIGISFHNASGDDLIIPLGDERWKPGNDQSWWGGINPKHYNLDILLPNPHESWDNSIYNFRASAGYLPDENRPSFQMIKYDHNYKCSSFFGGQYSEGEGSWYLISTFQCPAINGLQDYLTYHIVCPIIFGDNLSHELVAFWDRDPFSGYPEERKSGEIFPRCTNAKFDGYNVTVKQEITESADNRDYYTYFIDIVLDR